MVPAAPSAVDGQDAYFNVPNVGASTCNDCHQLPTGTGNDFFEDGVFLDSSRRGHFFVPGYNGMWRKEQQARAQIQWADGVVNQRAVLGAGITHAGLRDGVVEFVGQVFTDLTEQQRRDVAFFGHQVDSGLAPMVHQARLLDHGPNILL